MLQIVEFERVTNPWTVHGLCYVVDVVVVVLAADIFEMKASCKVIKNVQEGLNVVR